MILMWWIINYPRFHIVHLIMWWGICKFSFVLYSTPHWTYFCVTTHVLTAIIISWRIFYHNFLHVTLPWTLLLVCLKAPIIFLTGLLGFNSAYHICHVHQNKQIGTKNTWMSSTWTCVSMWPLLLCSIYLISRPVRLMLTWNRHSKSASHANVLKTGNRIYFYKTHL